MNDMLINTNAFSFVFIIPIITKVIWRREIFRKIITTMDDDFFREPDIFFECDLAVIEYKYDSSGEPDIINLIILLINTLIFLKLKTKKTETNSFIH